jgi:hypothetical protein
MLLVSRPARLRLVAAMDGINERDLPKDYFYTFTLCIPVCGKQDVKSIQINVTYTMPIPNL